jgi:hypothetical protein
VSHLDEGRLALLYYGEPEEGDRAHVAACDECRAALRAVARDLDAVGAGDVPERGLGFEAEVWERMAPRLGPRRARRPWSARPVWAAAAVAASLAVAFVLGRATAPVPPRTASTDPQVRERVLVLALGDHLDRSELFLAELANADPAQGPALDGESAQSLLTANRLVRQSADQAGDEAASDVLGELERILAEAVHASAEGRVDDLAALQARLKKRGLLFKVRVLGARTRDRERVLGAPAAPGTL